MFSKLSGRYFSTQGTFFAVFINDINNKIDKLTNVKINDSAEAVSNISYTEWLKNKITT